MNSTQLPRELDLATAVGLLMECPKHRGNPPDCALFELRKLTLMERFEWARSSTPEELAAILSHCSECVGVRSRHIAPDRSPNRCAPAIAAAVSAEKIGVSV